MKYGLHYISTSTHRNYWGETELPFFLDWKSTKWIGAAEIFYITMTNMTKWGGQGEWEREREREREERREREREREKGEREREREREDWRREREERERGREKGRERERKGEREREREGVTWRQKRTDQTERLNCVKKKHISLICAWL